MGQIDIGIANYFYSCIPHTGGSRPASNKGGRGGGQSSRPLVKGGRPVSKKFFFGPSGLSQFGLKIRGAPPPGSASVPCKTSCIVVVFILYSFPQPSCTFIFMVHVSVQNVQVSLLAKHQQVLPPQNLVLHFPRLADFPLCVQYSGK